MGRVFPRLEAHGPVDEVEVQVVQLQLLAGIFHQVLVVKYAPQLADDEKVLTLHDLILELHLEGQPHFLFPEPKNNETPSPLPSQSRRGRFHEAQGCEGPKVEGIGQVCDLLMSRL